MTKSQFDTSITEFCVFHLLCFLLCFVSFSSFTDSYGLNVSSQNSYVKAFNFTVMEARPLWVIRDRWAHESGTFMIRLTQTVKNLPAMQETPVWSLGQEDSLQKEMATHSRIIAHKSHGQRSLVATVHGVAKNQTWLNDQHFHFQEETVENLLSLFSIWGHGKKVAICNSWNAGQDPSEKSAGILILDFQKLWENAFLLFKAPSFWYFVSGVWADWNPGLYYVFPTSLEVFTFHFHSFLHFL